MKPTTLLAAAPLLALALAAAAQDATPFDAAVARFAPAISAATGPGLDAIEAWTPGASPPGALDDLVERVGATPLGPDAVPRLAALVGRDDPFLQEAGLRLARAAARQGLAADVGPAVDAAAARAVGVKELDPWVLLAAVQLVEATSDRLERTLAALAGWRPRAPGATPPPGPSTSRMRPADAEARAGVERALGAWLGRAGAADAALLARLEQLHGTKGLEATRAAVEVEAALRLVYVALSEGDRDAASRALARAREADERAGKRRAVVVEHLAAIVAPPAPASR